MTILPIKYPTKRIESKRAIFHLIKDHSHITKVTSFNCEMDRDLDRLQMLNRVIKFCRKAKYIRSFRLSKDPLYTPEDISKLLGALTRLHNIKSLKLLCQNSCMEDRVTKFSTVSWLKYFRRLDSITLNIFFDSTNQKLYKKFGWLLQFLKVKRLIIKEPLTLVSEKQIRHFYSKLNRLGSNLECLKISNCTPFGGPIEKYTPYRFVRNSRNLKELNLNFIGLGLKNECFNRIVASLKSLKQLKALHLNLSFNDIFDITRIEQFKDCNLHKLTLNFSHCPLNQNSISSLIKLISTLKHLLSIKLVMSSINLDERNIDQLFKAIGTQELLEEIGLNLDDNQCLSSHNLSKLFNETLSSKNLKKAEFHLNKAFNSRDLSPDLQPQRNSLLALRTLELDLGYNRITEQNIIYLLDYFKSSINIEELSLSLECMKFKSEETLKTLFEWIKSLKKLLTLELSLASCEIPDFGYENLIDMLVGSKLEYLFLDLTDVIISSTSASLLCGTILGLKSLKCVRIMSSLVYKALPDCYSEMLKKYLPGCGRFEVN